MHHETQQRSVQKRRIKKQLLGNISARLCAVLGFSVNSAASPRPSGCLLKAPRGRPPISVAFSPCAGYAPRFWCLAAVQYHSCKCFALPAAVPFGHAVFDIYLELWAVYFGVYDAVRRGGLMLQRHWQTGERARASTVTQQHRDGFGREKKQSVLKIWSVGRFLPDWCNAYITIHRSSLLKITAWTILNWFADLV